MDKSPYEFKTEEDCLSFEFYSEGPNGHIKKIVMYERIGEDLYNLALGDWDENTKTIDYDVTTNNGDWLKV